MIKEFFTWTKKERIGVIVLSLILLLMISGDVFFHRIFSKKTPALHPDTLAHYQSLLHDLENELLAPSNKTASESNFSKNETQKVPKIRSTFDPNDLSKNEWQNLGFSEKQAQAILRYKQQLKGFKTKEELSNSYVISEAKYKELEPFVKIKLNELTQEVEAENANVAYGETKKERIDEKIMLELNSADSVSLLKLKGIGPFYASKIIAYRKELGNYVSTEQLLELWKFDSSKLACIAENIWIDTTNIKKLNINTDTLETLKEHPYIDWNHARAIVNYREQHGVYQNKKDLLKIVLFDDSLINKLYPYISLD